MQWWRQACDRSSIGTRFILDPIWREGLAMNRTTPANEPGRLDALKNYAIVDTLPEIGFDEIAELASQICDCPAALVSFVDASRQWNQSKVWASSGGAFRMPAGNFDLQGHDL